MDKNLNNNDKMIKNEERTDENLTEFVRFGRTGRRNAIADVEIDPNANLSTKNITELLKKIDCKNSNQKDEDGKKNESS